MINSSFRGSSASRALRVLCLLTLATVATGCSSKAKRDTPDNPFRPGTDVGSGGVPQSEAALKAQARDAYVKAHLALLNTDYEVAIEQYSQLIARYPFTEFATQAELEKVYAQYRSFRPDEALLAADRFLREHPRHKHADYIQYLKGLVNAARTESISDYLPIDSSKKDVNAERRAYDDFAVLVQRYPQSVYAGDARKRMVHLRNRIASHELSIIRFYVKRQAWVAVSKRAENLIAEYPGAPATAEALNLLKLGYEKLDLKPQLADLERIIAANPDTFRLADAPPVEPGPRSRIGLPDASGNSPVSTLKAPVAAGPTLKATAAAPTATPTATEANKDAPKGFFARLASYLNLLNESYTLDSEQGKDSPAPPPAGGEQPNAPVAAASEAQPTVRPSTRNPEQRNSLTTGPYFEDTQVDVRPVTGSTPAAAPAPAAESATAGAPATDKPAEAPKKSRGFFGWLDGLSGSYTVSEDGKVVETPASEPATPPPAADKPAEAAPAN